MASRQRVLGSDHPRTLVSHLNLVSFGGMAGDAVGAAQEVQEIASGLERLLGADHPATLIARANLARWQEAAGEA